MTITELASEYARYTSAVEFGTESPATVLPNTTITGTVKA
jgi:hypothetical protein